MPGFVFFGGSADVREWGGNIRIPRQLIGVARARRRAPRSVSVQTFYSDCLPVYVREPWDPQEAGEGQLRLYGWMIYK